MEFCSESSIPKVRKIEKFLEKYSKYKKLTDKYIFSRHKSRY